MSGSKAALKAAKAALDAQNYHEAVNQAHAVLASDPKNYFAHLFLGRGLDRQGKTEDAIQAYESATAIKPNDDQAWLGLRMLYEAQGHRKVSEYTDVSIRLGELYVEQDDKHRCQTTIDKLTSFAKENGTRAQYKRALEVLLPASSLFDFLEGRIPHPSHTYQKIADIVEIEEKERINKEIGERRTRIGARVGQVTVEVKREVFMLSPLENIYQQIIDWSENDETRREYEEKLLGRAYELLTVLPKEEKQNKRTEVVKQAHGMVIIKHPFQLAWQLELEWKDFEKVSDLDAGILREFIDFFGNDGLAKVLKGYLSSEISPFPYETKEEKEIDEEKDEETPTLLNAEDRLVMMTDGLQDAENSALAHRLMSEYYLYIEEYQTAVDTARDGLKILNVESTKSGLLFQEDKDAVSGILATSLVHHQSPKNHPEARSIFDKILARKPTYTPALIGIGLMLEEEEEFAQAADFLGRALQRDPSNVRIAAEFAWCKARAGDIETGMIELEKQLPQVKTDNPRSRDLRALTLYRIGICQWELNTSKSARKDRKGAYAQFLAAIKMNVNFAPAYTSLGLYYADYARDRKRARQCFQKAFELSSSELIAAERLARSFADQRDWDIVEIIAQRAIDSGKVRISPGSRRKPVSWPYSALGVVQMNKQEYSKSVASFLAALRIRPDDYNSYVGLGESYHNSGRYNSASKTFHYAEELAEMSSTIGDERWFTKYMLANVNRELGNYSEAIEGYNSVLKIREKEFGVLIALLQTYNELSWRCIELGFFGRADEYAKQVIHIATIVAADRPDAFNLWKSLSDACSVFTQVQSRVEDVPLEEVRKLLESGMAPDEYDTLVDIDGVGHEQLKELGQMYAQTHSAWLTECLHAAILAQKRAIYACSHDTHAQAVAWYNLGWTEYRTHTSLEIAVQSEVDKHSTRYLKAAMRCFKRAIELEAGNAEFWNALGVVTSPLNPKVAQHSFVRGLHLNERSARTWTNLGTLYLLQNDLELAHTAFARAQSTDPDYGHAWLGEGLLALLWDDSKEGLSHFTHAFEISDSASLIAKRQYTTSAFDNIISAPIEHNNITSLIQPLFALQQLEVQSPIDLPYKHLAALYFERVGHYTAAIHALSSVCSTAEMEYEDTESLEALAHYSQAKADLGRNQLAARDFGSAAENAETALALSSEADSSALAPEGLRKLRLSAHLTAGLANHYNGNTDQAIQMFRSALEESHSAPDVVCALAEVLWAKGGENEKNVAREQLFDCVEKNPENVGSRVLLGAIAALDEDEDVMEAAKEDLQGIRTLDGLDTKQQRRIEEVLEAISLMISGTDTAGDSINEEVRGEIATSIMLSPSQPHGWSELAAVSGDSYPAQMALMTAVRAVPPYGPLGSEDLAKAYAGARTIGDAQRGIMLSAWMQHPWEAFASVLA
ncbi:TPR-like protein [Viridothelium virens]|uniref:TPR-like protein n=1 Tax=Viridothelium virens TaxID=1048519 RepID=A0A6A6HH77_VIRVR|nr:TPR-like protein [Viridothelium virens]